jgi:Zn-dependent peptidase ImmA (M78 family)
MTLRVPYIADDAIERDAAALLAEYAIVKRVEIRAPIPIEDIVEKYLKLRVEFDDLHRLLDVPRSGPGLNPDIFGAIWLESGKIVIDESLDPEERPELEGRYRFTLAHEGGGHWRLHRPLVRTTRDQTSVLIAKPRPTVVCRSSQAKVRVEWQADFYASCLLMPRKLVFAAWDEMFPDRKQRVIQPRTPIEHRYVEIARLEGFIAGGESTENDDLILERFAKPLAKKFLVSPVAMRIRLEKLGLLHRVVPGLKLLEKLDQLAAGTYGPK